MSKLYTKKEIKRRLENPFEEITINEFIESLTPIQLPTDEDIHRNRPYESISDWGIGFHSGWKEGAKWMRDKIKGGGDE